MIKRELYLKRIRPLIDTDFIKVIIGMRRCGKTVFLKSIIDELIEKGVKPENIIYISFESVKYKNIFTEKELDELILKLTKDIKGKIYLLFDEIHK